MFTMINKITTALKQHCGVSQGQHITIALSGGKDSMVLATALLSLQTELNLSLSAVHIHHGLRAASDEEELFVCRWCEEHGLPLEVHHLNLTEHKGASLEMAARQARYDIFQKYILLLLMKKTSLQARHKDKRIQKGGLSTALIL